MKVSTEKLYDLLEKETAGCYFCSGNDTFLVNELVDTMVSAGKKKDFVEWSRVYIESNQSWEQAYSAVHTPSLFSPKIAVIIQLGNWKLDENAKALLTNMSENNYHNRMVIIKGPKLERATSQTKWFQSMTGSGLWIDLPTIYPNQVPDWLQHRASRYNLKLTRDNAVHIARRTENNLPAAAEAIEKLQLLNKTINTKSIDDIIDLSADYDAFKLIDACLAQDGERAYQIFSQLKNSQIEPVMMIGAMARELRLIRDLFDAIAEKIPLKTAAQKLGIWESKLSLLQHFMRLHKQEFCQQMLAELGNCDAIAKGAIQGNVWHSLFKLSMMFAGVKP